MKKTREKGISPWKCLQLLLFPCFLLQLSLPAQAATPQEMQRVSLNLQNADIKSLFAEIRKQTTYNFVYSDDQMDNIKPITIRAQNERTDNVLERVFRNTPYDFRIEGNTIAIVSRASTSPRTHDMITIRGRVTDKEGMPLPGVSVFIQSTTLGNTTNVDGYYELTIPTGSSSVLVFTFVGMKTATIPYSDQQEINVTLEVDDVGLADVVVIGYGTKSKRDLTSSVSSLHGDDVEKYFNGASTIDNLLGGAITGLRVSQSSGKPGALSTINVRGITSPISGGTNEPLYVIDGVPFFVEKDEDMLNPLLTLSPNDIESIDVLKDAAATSIYGSRGANGVIIINTKNGRRNQPTRISAGYTLSVANPVKKYTPLNTDEFKSVQDLIIRNTVNAVNKGQIDIWDILFTPGYTNELGPDIPNFGVSVDYDDDWNMTLKYDGLNQNIFGQANTNWVEEVRNKNAITHQYNIGLRGGTELSNYSFSFNAMNQEGLYVNEKLDRYGARLALDTDVSKYIKAGGVLNYSYSERTIGDDLSYMGSSKEWIFRPDVPVKNENGSWGTADGSLLYYSPVYLANPLAMQQRDNLAKSKQFTGNAYVEILPVRGLKLRGDINLSVFDLSNSVFSPTYAMDDFYTGYGMDPIANLQETSSSTTYSSINFRADYNHSWQKHHLNAMAGFSWDRNFNQSSSNYYQDFPDDEILTNISSAAESLIWTGGKSKGGLNSMYARVSYNYDEKYLAEVNFRTDASSKFGPGNKRAYFPALSLGWRMSEESFITDIEAINDLKLRFSIGQTGSTNVSDFSYKQFFSRNSNSLYGGESAVILSTSFPNVRIKWETTTEYNGGIDFTLFNYSLFGSIDAYYRYTKDVLAPSPISLETGATSFYSNLMDMSNKGMEFEIGAHIFRRPNFKWMAKFNLAFNRNVVEKLNNATMSTFQADAYVEGKPAGVLKGYKVLGIFQDDDEVTRLNELAHQKNPDVYYYQAMATGAGDYYYKDINGDGRISSDDRVVLTSPEPRYFGGFLSNLGYKNLSLSCTFQFSVGTKALLESLRTDNYGSLGQNIYRELYGNTWTAENPHARYARLVTGDPNSNTRASDRFVFSTSYLRMKNVMLSYNIPHSLLRKLNIESALLFVSGSNLFTWSNWPGLDPEVVSANPYSGLAGQTTNDDPHPLSKTFSVGIKLDF